VRGFERLLVDCVQYLFEHAIEILEHFVVPKPEDEVTTRFQILGSTRILLSLLVVLAAVEFDDELRVWATEIDDKSVQRHLAPELQTAKPSVAQSKPQNALGIGLMPSQATRGLEC
jgi:hypothetical protein